MRLLATALLSALLLAPVAAAQVPNTAPTYTLEITSAPAELAGIASNTTATGTVSISLTLSGVLCTEATTIPVTVTATPRTPPPFFALAVEPSVIEVTIGQGPHGVGPAGPAGGNGDAVLTATVGEITSNASVAIDVVATAPAPSGCQGTGAIPAATSAPATVFANMTAPPPPPPPTPEEDTPGPAALLVVAVAVGVALVRRRRLG